MKVLWIAPIKYPGTLGHPAPWIEELAINLSKYIEITILGYSRYVKNSIKIFHYDNLTKIFLKTPNPKIDIFMFYLNQINTLKKWLKENYTKYDLIHIHGNEHQYEVSCKDIHIPKILSIQGIISEYLKYYNPKGLKKISWYIKSFYEKRYYQSIDNYICRTGWDSNVVKHYHPNAKIFNVWEVIRKQFFIKDTLQKGDNILFLGGGQIIKGLHFALKSFDLVKDEIKGKLLIGGNINYEILKKFIEKNHISNDILGKIEILGFLTPEGIIENAKKSFCLLHPTLIDNSPNSVCEAQIMGLPVVATKVGGVPALIDNKETGILCELDAEVIAKNVLSLFFNDKLWSHISNSSREIARKRHDTNEIVNKTLSIYEELISS